MSPFNKKAQATRWVIRNCTAADPTQHQADFQAWLAKDPLHQRLYDTRKRRWEEGIERLRLRALQYPQYSPEVVIRTERARMATVRRRTQTAVAMCFLGALGSAVWFRGGPGLVPANPWVTYQSDTAQMGPMSLNDGSVVLLNTHSQVRVRLNESARRFVLDSGEAFFDVNPDATRPFDVEAGAAIATVHAMNTAFSVKKDNDGQIEAAVAHGKLEVKSAESPERPAAARSTPPEIKAGEVATFGSDGKLLRKDDVGSTEMANRLAWANPLHTLDGMTLKEAIELFNRYNVRKLAVSEPGLDQTRVGGTFHLAEPEVFVESLEALGIDHVSQGPESRADARILLVRK